MLVKAVAPVAATLLLGTAVALAAGWSPTLATAAPDYGHSVELGVSDETVRLLPPVVGDEKFVSSLAVEGDTEAGVFSEKQLRVAAVPKVKAVSQKASAPKSKIAPKVAASKAKSKAKALTVKTTSSSGWKSAKVSWYGPGLYGNTMAGGGQLTPSSMVVAHRSMKFGTRIEFSYQGRTVIAVVQDRGPYTGGRVFDLGPGTAKALGFSGVGTVKYRIVK